jgi:hypothetical protein
VGPVNVLAELEVVPPFLAFISCSNLVHIIQKEIYLNIYFWNLATAAGKRWECSCAGIAG